MKRRTVLTTLGISFASLTTGCTAMSQTSSGGSEASDRRAVESPINTSNNTRTMTFAPERVVEEIKLGDQTTRKENLRPHSLKVWNDASISQTIQVIITTEKETVLDKAYDIPADTAVTVVLRDPAEYTAVLQSEETETSIKIEEKWFDCNYSSTNVVLTANRQFRSEFVTTWLECGSSVTMPDEKNASTTKEDT